jgi:hypothetical protein
MSSSLETDRASLFCLIKTYKEHKINIEDIQKGKQFVQQKWNREKHLNTGANNATQVRLVLESVT